MSLQITAIKRRASHSPQGELLPAAVIAKTDHPIVPDMQTVFSRLDMGVPDDAMVDTEIDDNTVNTQVKRRLAEYPQESLKLLERAIRNVKVDEECCSDAIDELASVLLPAVFDHGRNDNRVSSYKDIIKCNPWLIKMLIDAHKSEKYHVIRRLRSCSVQIVRLLRLTLLISGVFQGVFPSLHKGESRQETPRPEHTFEGKTGESQTSP